MSYDGRAVANRILDLCEAEGVPITNLSLQKLVYFCHAWCLVKLGRPLIRHQFEAWQHGPVLQYLYREFKCFESGRISTRAKGLNPTSGEYEVVSSVLDSSVDEVVQRVLAFYARLRPGTLVELSHVPGGPWEMAWNHLGKSNPGMKIKDESIVEYYRSAISPF